MQKLHSNAISSTSTELLVRLVTSKYHCRVNE